MTNKVKYPFVRLVSMLLVAVMALGIMPTNFVPRTFAVGAIQAPSMENHVVPGSSADPPPAELILKEKILYG